MITSGFTIIENRPHRVDTRRRAGDRHRSGYVRPARSQARVRPFVGCDGEGGGTDDLGRQNYLLFRMGDRELYLGRPLTTLDCLQFITDHPKGDLLVGFAFGYDVTMILRDLPSDRRARLLAPLETGEGKSRYTWFGGHDGAEGFGLEYLPRQYFRVCRVLRGKVVPGSSRTIFETFGFFQMSFVRALKAFGIGTDMLPEIEAMKDARSSFDVMTDQVRSYCRMECGYLAELMEKLRRDCHAAGMFPHTWNGAGKLASCLHETHATPRRKDIETIIPDDVKRFAAAAYYGGRFETTRAGAVAGPVHEYDIRSAYPAAMRKLPCLIHGRWERMTRNDCVSFGEASDPSGLYCASVEFSHDPRCFLAGLPIRRKEGNICWPLQGRGVYWSVEIDAGRKLGCRIRIRDGWKYVPQCECQSFGWVNDLYEYRKKLGSKGEGYPIKLGINSLYGKLAQRIGTPKFGNLIWAGLITAQTRALLMEAASHSPENILMLATDAVYSTVPLPLDIGEKLGQWEHSEHARMFIVQPGLYWGPPKPKTRGIPPKFFETRTGDFEAAWDRWREFDTAAHRDTWQPPPSVPIELTMFIGLKLAQARGKPDTAGRWVRQTRDIRFDWSRKRGSYRWGDGHVITQPLAGASDWNSVLYSDLDPASGGPWDEAREEAQDQPDYLDLSPPWKD